MILFRIDKTPTTRKYKPKFQIEENLNRLFFMKLRKVIFHKGLQCLEQRLSNCNAFY